MGETQFKNFEVDGAAIYRIVRKPIKAKFVLIKRGKLQREIIELTNHIKEKQQKLSELQAEFNFYSSPEMDALLRRQAQEEKIATEKAQQLLREYIGEENFKTLISKGVFRFTAKNGKKYEIKSNGTVYSVGSGRYRLCIIRPHNLPLPDIVLAILNNIKNEPNRFREIGRR